MNKFPWNCGECPMLHTYDLSIDDLTHICLWSKSQIDDCDRYKSAECPMEKHDEEIRANERAKAIEEYKEEVLSRFCECCDQYACNGAMIGSTQECATIRMLQDVCTDVANELKEQK